MEKRASSIADGAQHTFFNPFFHSSYEKFEQAQERDCAKDAICKAHGVWLIRVPYWAVNGNNLLPFLRAKLVQSGYLSIDGTRRKRNEAEIFRQTQGSSSPDGDSLTFAPSVAATFIL